MSHYYSGNHHRIKQRFVKKAKVILVLLGIVLLLIATGIIVDTLLNQKHSTQNVDSTVETKAAFAPSTQTFRSATFQFQAPNSWKFIPNESTAIKQIYRSFNKNLVLRELDVYVNTPAVLTEKVTYVMPVKTDEDTLTPSDVSDHCKKGMPPVAQQPNAALITFANVQQVFCNPSGVDYTVIAGEIGGSTLLHLKQQNGKAVTYQILFRDVTISPDPREFTAILQSFQPL